MAMRSAKVSMERRTDGGMNDNYPSVLPGHELTGLEGVPRPPTGEAVAHYSRFTEIGSFPDHPAEPAVEATEALPMDASPEKPCRAASGHKAPLLFSGLGSCLFHAVILAALLFTFVARPKDAQEEAGDTVSVIVIGNSDADQMASGEEIPQSEQEQMAAEAMQPTEVTPEDVQPQQPDTVQPQVMEAQQAQTAEPVEPIEQNQPVAVAPEQPQILATQAPAETTVVQPTESVQPVNTQIAEAQTIVAPSEVVTPVEKPKPVKRPKEVKKPAAKIAKVKSGSRGESQENSKKGSVDGTETAQSDHNSQANARRTGAGSAAVANYPGKVQSRIRRAVRLSSRYEPGITVRVRLTIGSSGDLTALSIARSSGFPELDEAVTSGIRRAAPFPPLPPEWGRPSWSFTQEVQVTGR